MCTLEIATFSHIFALVVLFARSQFTNHKFNLFVAQSLVIFVNLTTSPSPGCLPGVRVIDKTKLWGEMSIYIFSFVDIVPYQGKAIKRVTLL